MPEIQDPTKVVGAILVKPIPEKKPQTGPTCGLYALSIVIRFWHNLLVQKGVKPSFQEPAPRGAVDRPSVKEQLNREIEKAGGKVPKNPAKFTGVQMPAHDLLQIAETLGSRVGEVLDAESLADVARHAKLEAWVVRWSKPAEMFPVVRHHIDQNVPLIVCYDVIPDRGATQGDPGLTKGEHAHWAVIFGYVDKAPRKVLATHGWGAYYEWNADDLAASNAQIDEFAQGGIWHRAREGGKVVWKGPRHPKPAVPLAHFFIPHEMDVKKQFVVVVPPGVSDYSAPEVKIPAVTAASTRGEKY
jgi:hypothetical protein